MKKILPVLWVLNLGACATTKNIPSTYRLKVETNIADIKKANNLVQTALIRDGFSLKRNDQQMGIMESDARAVAVRVDQAFPTKVRYRSNLILTKSGVEIIMNYECAMAAVTGGGGLLAAQNVGYAEFGGCSVTTFGKTTNKKDIVTESIETENNRITALVRNALQN